MASTVFFVTYYATYPYSHQDSSIARSKPEIVSLKVSLMQDFAELQNMFWVAPRKVSIG